MRTNNHFIHKGTKRLIFSAVAIALAFAASYLKIWAMPWGGSVTLCSMLLISLVGYFYGIRAGLTAAFAYGLLQLFQDGGSYIVNPFQVLFDYILSFMALGLTGFFRNRKNGLIIGYLISILGRLLFLSIGGYLFWMSYMPDNFPTSLSVVYPIIYNGSFILVEGIITIIIISVPSVKDAIANMKKLAND